MHSQEPERRYFTALALLERGDLPRARRELECLTIDHPRFVPAWDGLAQCHEAAGDLLRAESCYRRALWLDRGNWRSRYHWARALHRAGNYSSAKRLLQAALRRAPDIRCLHAALGYCLLDDGDARGALDAFRRALRKREDEVSDLELHRALAMALADAGELEAAEAACQTAALLSPDDAALCYQWAGICAQRGDLRGASQLAGRAALLQPRSLRPALLRATLALAGADPGAVQALVSELASTVSGARLALALRAALACRTGEFANARQLALQALAAEGPVCEEATDRALAVLRELRGCTDRCRGYRIVVEAVHGRMSYFRPYLVLARDEAHALGLIAEIQDALDAAPWSTTEVECFPWSGPRRSPPLAGVYQVLLTRVLFPRGSAAA